MTPVKPLTVVTKVGTWLPRRGLSMGLGDDGEQFVHEDCVTLADAERYAREKVEEAIERERWPKSVPESEIVQPSLNHGAFYLETQADLVLKERLGRLEAKIEERLVSLPAGILAWAPLHDMVSKEVQSRMDAYVSSLLAYREEIMKLKDRVKEIERI